MIKVLIPLIVFLTSNLSLAISARTIKDINNARMASRLNTTEEAAQLVQKLAFDKTLPELNYFQKLRLELNKAAQEEIELSKKRGVLVNSLIKLTPDTLGFFVATGAVNFMTMWNQSGGNPLLFQEQVLALKDPVANFSFYSFIAANGFYTQWATKGIDHLSAEEKHMKIRRASYMALAAGSLASSFSADIGHTIESCSALLVNNKGSSSSYIEKTNALCNSALEIWTARNLSQKYFPQIFSLLVVQGITEFTQNLATKGISYTATQLGKALLSVGEKAGFKISAIDVILTATPGKFGVQAFKIIGKITQFTFFVGIDHIFNNTLTRGFNNIFKPILFKAFDQSALDKLIKTGANQNWNSEKLAKQSPQFKSEMTEEILNFTTRMQEWRDHLNSDVEQDLTQWMSFTKRIYNQVSISREYYSRFLDEAFSFLYHYYKINLPEGDSNKLSIEAWNNTTGYPYKPLPLYGVKFIPWVNSDGKVTNVKEEQAYLLFPKETEKAQSKFLKDFAQHLSESSYYKDVVSQIEEKEFLYSIIEQLKEGAPKEQGLALKKLADYKLVAHQKGHLEFVKFRAELFKNIGYSEPKLQRGEGFNEAFIKSNSKELEDANFDGANLFSSNTTLFSPTALMMYSMICSQNSAVIQEFEYEKLHLTFWEPNFFPPKIVSSSASEFCDPKNRVYEENFYITPLTNSSGVKSNNVTDYVMGNLNMSILGDYKDKSKRVDFTKWWADQVLWKLTPYLEKWNVQYQQLTDRLDNNLFDKDKSWTLRLTDAISQFNWANTNLMSSSIVDSFRFEKDFYTQVSYLFVKKNKLTLPSTSHFSILEEIKKISVAQKSKNLAPLEEEPYKKISTLLESMITELQKPVKELDISYQTYTDEELKKVLDEKKKNDLFEKQLNYKKFLDLKNDFDQQISKLEARVGLKKEEADPINENSSTFEDLKVATPNLEQSVVQACAQGLRNIESSMTRYAQMKLLKRYGLKFSKEEIQKTQQEALSKACSKSTMGCK